MVHRPWSQSSFLFVIIIIVSCPLCAEKEFKGAKLIELAPASTDINPIEILWSIIQRDAYENRKRHSIRNFEETVIELAGDFSLYFL